MSKRIVLALVASLCIPLAAAQAHPDRFAVMGKIRVKDPQANVDHGSQPCEWLGWPLESGLRNEA